MICQLTKIAHFSLCHKTVADTKLTNLFLKKIVSLHEPPDSIISDCSSIFTSQFLVILYNCLKVKQKLFTAFHTETDRQIKQTN